MMKLFDLAPRSYDKVVCPAFLACCLFSASLANALDTKFSALEAVNEKGVPIFTTNTRPITLTGVVINNPYDMLDGTQEWQAYLQTVDGDDYGGSALYMRKTHPVSGTVLYDDGPWANELSRPMYSGTDGLALGYGDVIRVTAGAPGMGFRGKYNINEMHTNNLANDFSIEVLQRDTAPSSSLITLDNLKDATNGFRFSEDRSGLFNCEHYQGSLVHLENLILDSGEWEQNGVVQVRQIGQGDRTFDLKLGLDSDLFTTQVQSQVHDGPFSVTAILDQEDFGTTPDGVYTYYTGGYRLWLTSASGLSTVPEPSAIVLLTVAIGGLLAYAWRKRSAAHSAIRG